MLYELTKAAHLLSLFVWIGGMVAVGIALRFPTGTDMKPLKAYDRAVTTPAMILALALGILLGVQGGWFALPDPNRSAAFRSRYQAAYGASPHPIGALAYDGVAAIGALVSQRGSNALTGAALTQNAGFQGASGVFRLRPDGTNERGLAVATIQNRQVVQLSPAPQSFGGAGF